MSMFPTDAHLASWAGLCPGNHESAGKRKSGKPRKGNTHLQPFLVEAAWAAVRTEGRLKARYDRLVRRFGGYRRPKAKNKAIFAIAHTIAVIIWHVLHDEVPYADLGADFYTRRDDRGRERPGSSPSSPHSATKSPSKRQPERGPAPANPDQRPGVRCRARG
jgi:transposase